MNSTTKSILFLVVGIFLGSTVVHNLTSSKTENLNHQSIDEKSNPESSAEDESDYEGENYFRKLRLSPSKHKIAVKYLDERIAESKRFAEGAYSPNRTPEDETREANTRYRDAFDVDIGVALHTASSSAAQQRIYFSYRTKELDAAPDYNTCIQLAEGEYLRSSRMAKIQETVFEKMSLREFNEFVNFLKINNPVFNELGHTPSFTSNELDTARRAYSSRLSQNAQKQFPADMSQAVLDYLKDGNSTNAEVICKANRLRFQTLLQLNGRTGEVMRQASINDIAHIVY